MAQTSIQAGQLLSRCQRGRSRRPGRSLRAAASPRYTAVLAVCACDKQPCRACVLGVHQMQGAVVVASAVKEIGLSWRHYLEWGLVLLCEAACRAVEPPRLHLFVDVPDFFLKVVDDEGVFVFGVSR